MTFFLGDDRPVPASAGSFVDVAGRAAHAFRVDPGTARYLIITTAQHERFYRAISEPVGSRTLPPEAPMDMARVMAAAEQYNVEVLGPPPGASA